MNQHDPPTLRLGRPHHRLLRVLGALCIAFGIRDIVLPRPTQILVTLWQRMPAIWPHALQTLYTTLVGFALGILAGVLLGVVIGSSRLAYDVAYPLLIGFSSIPKVAVVPIFVLWFGAGTVPAVLTAMISASSRSS